MTLAKSLLVGCIAASCCVAVSAQAQVGRMDTGLGLYVGAGVGSARSEIDTTGIAGSSDENDVGWKVFAGYRFHRYAAVELGYYDLGKVTFNGTLTTAIPPFPAGTATSGSFRTRAGALSLVGIYPFADTGFSVQGRIGLAYSRQKARVTLGALGASADEDATEITYGLGLGYDFSRNLGVRGDWERFRVGGNNTGGKNDVDLFSVNLLYRFQ